MNKGKSKSVFMAIAVLILLSILVGGGLWLFKNNSSDKIEADDSALEGSNQEVDDTESADKCFASTLPVSDLDFLSSTMMLPKEDYYIEDVRSNYTFDEIKDGAFGMQYFPSEGSYYLAYELCDTDTDSSLSSDGLDDGNLDIYNVAEAPEYGDSRTTSFKYQIGDNFDYTIESDKNYILYVLYSTDGTNWMVDSSLDFSVN